MISAACELITHDISVHQRKKVKLVRFCSHVRCTKQVVNNGVCVEHGAMLKCSNHAGCTKLVVLNKSASSMERW